MNTGTFLLDSSSTPGSSTVLGTNDQGKAWVWSRQARVLYQVSNSSWKQTVKGQAGQEQAGSTTGC